MSLILTEYFAMFGYFWVGWRWLEVVFSLFFIRCDRGPPWGFDEAGICWCNLVISGLCACDVMLLCGFEHVLSASKCF